MNAMSEKLLEEFAEHYFEKLFYFCLKKTGDSVEAEDLASDITLNVIRALRKGTVPGNFPAWVWQIAKNRYSEWADRRRKKRESDSGAVIGEVELADERAQIEEEWMHKEELKLLRREMAFIASDYRNIVVKYYIEDRSVRDIAHLLELPEGTVKSKLSRARKRLKEGMNMAREFGTMSYRPEEISFVSSCWQFGAEGEPWCHLRRMLCRNILLAAYRTPSTAEELAVELGVALPYMEDELRWLVDATLLQQSGRKYETNFFIISAKAQEKMYRHLRETAPELTKALISALEYRVKCLDENGVRWHEGYQPYEDMKWALLMRETDAVDAAVRAEQNGNETGRAESSGQSGSKAAGSGQSRAETLKLGEHGYPERPNGGEWDILGYEEYKGDEPAFVGRNGNGGVTGDRLGELWRLGIHLWIYQFTYRNICEETGRNLSFEEIRALAGLAGRGEPDAGEETFRELERKGFVRKGEGGYCPVFQVNFSKRMQELTEPQRAEYRRLRDSAKEIAMGYYRFCRDLIYREIPEFLKEDRHQIGFAVETFFQGMRGAVLEEALRTGYLIYEENHRRMLGVYMVLSDGESEADVY